jgi:hypothetical protein
MARGRKINPHTDTPTCPPSSLKRQSLNRISENHCKDGEVYGIAVTIAHAHNTFACRRVEPVTEPRLLVNLQQNNVKQKVETAFAVLNSQN